MANLNRYKFTFGKKSVTLTTKHDNLFMEEVEKVATEKYHAIRFIASGSQHDFDRDTDSAQTKELLKETITFLHTLI